MIVDTAWQIEYLPSVAQSTLLGHVICGDYIRVYRGRATRTTTTFKYFEQSHYIGDRKYFLRNVMCTK
jgi:hypothetical protein